MLSAFKTYRGSTGEILACSSTGMTHFLTHSEVKCDRVGNDKSFCSLLRQLYPIPWVERITVFPCPFSPLPRFSGVTRVWVHGSFMVIISGRTANVWNIFLTQNIFSLFIMQLQLSACYNEHFLLLYQDPLCAKYSF